MENHDERLRASYAAWVNHRERLEAYRAKPGDRRSTPPHLSQADKIFPELANSTVTTVRLHPRYGEESPLDASKIGGTFLWPATESWPVCPFHEIPLVTVLQLRASDFPEMPFPPGTDLFQTLWCPREHGERSSSPRANVASRAAKCRPGSRLATTNDRRNGPTDHRGRRNFGRSTVGNRNA